MKVFIKSMLGGCLIGAMVLILIQAVGCSEFVTRGNLHVTAIEKLGDGTTKGVALSKGCLRPLIRLNEYDNVCIEGAVLKGEEILFKGVPNGRFRLELNPANEKTFESLSEEIVLKFPEIGISNDLPTIERKVFMKRRAEVMVFDELHIIGMAANREAIQDGTRLAMKEVCLRRLMDVSIQVADICWRADGVQSEAVFKQVAAAKYLVRAQAADSQFSDYTGELDLTDAIPDRCIDAPSCLKTVHRNIYFSPLLPLSKIEVHVLGWTMNGGDLLNKQPVEISSACLVPASVGIMKIAETEPMPPAICSTLKAAANEIVFLPVAAGTYTLTANPADASFDPYHGSIEVLPPVQILGEEVLPVVIMKHDIFFKKSGDLLIEAVESAICIDSLTECPSIPVALASACIRPIQSAASAVCSRVENGASTVLFKELQYGAYEAVLVPLMPEYRKSFLMILVNAPQVKKTAYLSRL